MENVDSFGEVLELLRRRDNDGATEVYRRFCGRLIGLAQRQLEMRLRQKVDPEDVAQSAIKSVVLRLAEGQFALGDWDGLWGLLAQVTIHKCGRWATYFHAQGRDVKREQSAPAESDDSNPSWQFLDPEPTPREAAMLTEALDRVLPGLDQREQDMVTLSLQGYTVADVSGRLACTEAKVYRVLRHIRRCLEAMCDDE